MIFTFNKVIYLLVYVWLCKYRLIKCFFEIEFSIVMFVIYVLNQSVF
jgi:hypothetical protein